MTIDQRLPNDCLRCCLATVLCLPYEEVPHFVGDAPSRWADKMSKWLNGLGFAAVRVQATGDGEILHSYFDGNGATWIASGLTERGRNHATVWRGTEMIHDPHPSRAGLLTITAALVIVPIGMSGTRAG